MQYREKPLDEIYENFCLPKRGTSLSREEAMKLAFSSALQGAGLVFSNPLVGAVCVDHEHKFVEAAWHEGFGKDHAEQALAKKIYEKGLSHKLDKAIFYVTLEPCAHVGKTPSCSHILMELPLKKVVYGRKDRTRKASGKGLRLLEEKGILTEAFSGSFILQENLRFLTEHFECFEFQKKPFVSLKIATTLNGVFAHKTSQREWITCERSRKYAHFLRLLYDAVVVGAETVIQDNPSLTIRHLAATKVPLRVVLDPGARALLCRPLDEHNLLKSNATRTLWALKFSAYAKLSPLIKEGLLLAGCQVLFLKGETREESLKELCAFLYRENSARVLLEGGAALWGSAVNSFLADKLYLFKSAKIFSRPDIMHWTKEAKIPYLNVENALFTPLGKDLLIEGLTNDSDES